MLERNLQIIKDSFDDNLFKIWSLDQDIFVQSKKDSILQLFFHNANNRLISNQEIVEEVKRFVRDLQRLRAYNLEYIQDLDNMYDSLSKWRVYEQE